MEKPEKSYAGYVVVAVDGSFSSIEALRTGYKMSKLVGKPMVAVTAWHLSHGLLPPQSWEPEEDAKVMLTRSIREAFRPALAPEIETLTLDGTPAEALLKLSADAEMLVIGSRGHSGLAGVMLGSVSAVCAAHAKCPVLVVHEVNAADTADAPNKPDHSASDDWLSVSY